MESSFEQQRQFGHGYQGIGVVHDGNKGVHILILENRLRKIKSGCVEINAYLLLGTDYTDYIVPEFFANNNFVGRGISGQVSSQMLVRFQEDVINLQPKVVVICCGTNDIAQNNGYITLEHIVQNIKSMCELARANKIKPIVCSVLPATGFKWRPEMKPANDIIRLNEMIQAYAKANKIPYVDYHSALKDEYNGLPLQYSNDGVHPNAEGYAVMESVIMPILKKAL